VSALPSKHQLLLEGEVRSIELQDVPTANDELVLLLEFRREGEHILAIGLVVDVLAGPEQSGRHDAGCRGRNERIGECVACRALSRSAAANESSSWRAALSEGS